MRSRRLLVIALLTLPTHALADDPSDRIAALQDQVNAMQAQIEQIRAESSRHGEQARAIDRAVADAAQPPAIGGYKDGFLIATAPDFSMKLNGLLQPRYVLNFSDNDTGDDDEAGFVIRRAELYLSGNAIDPKLTYMFAGGFDRATGSFQTVFAYLNYQLDKSWSLRAGGFKGPFMVEELTAASRQQAIERSLVTSLFTMGYTEGVHVQYAKERVAVTTMFHDGSNALDTDFMSDNTDFGIAGRVEWFSHGAPKQFADFNGWLDSEPALRLGAAIDYEKAERGGAALPDVFKYTLDATYKTPGWSLLLVGAGKHLEEPDGETIDQYAVEAQAAVFVVPDKVELYTRYEHVWTGGLFGTAPAIDDGLDLATLGVNCFFHHHAAKLTLDVGYLFEAVPGGVSGVGIVASPGGPQAIVRAGVQLAF